MQAPICVGLRRRSMPRAASTSALPHLLDTPRLPCFATAIPDAATTKLAAVETLNVVHESPPVPHISISGRRREETRIALDRITLASPAISSTVSPLVRSPQSRPPSWAGVTL